MSAESARPRKRVGEEVGVSPWIEVTQERIDTFAKAIDDFQWIHVDRRARRHSPFGGTIAHGFLTLSLLSHLSERTFGFTDRKMGVNYGLNRVRFTSPVPSGSRVRARFTLGSSRSSPTAACRSPGTPSSRAKGKSRRSSPNGWEALLLRNHRPRFLLDPSETCLSLILSLYDDGKTNRRARTGANSAPTISAAA